MNARPEPAPTAGFHQPQNRDEQGAQPDEKELENLIEDSRAQVRPGPHKPPRSEGTQMLKLRFHPSTTFITTAMAYMSMPDMRRS